jgi:hypothetical protein
MTNAMESIRKYVEQEAAHELANGDLHDLVLVVAILTIVLPAKADMLVGEIEQPAVADRDAMGERAILTDRTTTSDSAGAAPDTPWFAKVILCEVSGMARLSRIP